MATAIVIGSIGLGSSTVYIGWSKADFRLLIISLGAEIALAGVLWMAFLRQRPMQHALRYSEQLQRFAFDLAPVGMVAVGPDGRFVRANASMCELTGYSVEELARMTVADLTHPDDRLRDAELLNPFLEGKAAIYQNEKRYLCKDGTIRWVTITARMVIDADARPFHTLGVIQDITERKRAELAMRDSEARLSRVLDSISDEVWFNDVNGRITLANPAAIGEFGPLTDDPAVAVHATDAALLHVHQQTRPLADSPAMRALAGEVVRDEEEILRVPSTGELRHRQVSSSPVRDAAGTIIGAVSVVRDITERKRTEAALREADRRKDIFLATLSHELRNPLAPLRSAARLLESPTLSQADMERCRSIIARQVAHMATLLDDLLDVSRLTRGSLSLKRARVLLQPVLDAAVETAQPMIDAKHHRLEWRAGPAAVVEVDPVRLTQVVSNLLINAAKYTQVGGRISLDCSVDHGTLVIAVADSGIGLMPEQFVSIFDMFAQGSPIHAEGGLGIGLALVRTIVNLHGGRIDVSSGGRDRGSTFTVTLPRAVISLPDRESTFDESDVAPTVLESAEPRPKLATAALELAQPAPKSATAALELAQPAPKSATDLLESVQPGPKSVTDVPESAVRLRASDRKRVLVADDNVDGARLLCMLIEDFGHEVHVAHDGIAALEAATHIRPDVAILDIGMPLLNGYEVARRIRNEIWGTPMTLIAVTGWGQDEDRRRALAVGFDHHVTKPADPQDLERLLRDTPARLASDQRPQSA